MKSSISLMQRRGVSLSGAALVLSLCAFGCESAEHRLGPEPGRAERKPGSASTTAAAQESTGKPAEVRAESPTVPMPAAKATTEAKATPKALEKTTESVAGDVKVARLVVTRSIEAREPVVGQDIDADGAPVFAFLELENNGSEPQDVVVTFEHETGKSVGHVLLNVPGKTPRWRTWGQTRLIRDAGTWTAVIRSAAGEELGRRDFEVSPS